MTQTTHTTKILTRIHLKFLTAAWKISKLIFLNTLTNFKQPKPQTARKNLSATSGKKDAPKTTTA